MFMDFAEVFGYIISQMFFLMGSFSNLGERSEWIFSPFLFIYGQIFNW
jgi:hypothetical protein